MLLFRLIQGQNPKIVIRYLSPFRNVHIKHQLFKVGPLVALDIMWLPVRSKDPVIWVETLKLVLYLLVPFVQLWIFADQKDVL